MSKINLKKVAAEALDAMTLQEHDLRYHDGHYRGGVCKFREEFDKPDRLDENLDAANDYEFKVWGSRRCEWEMLKKGIKNDLDLNAKKYKMRYMFLEPDQDGVNQFRAECDVDTPDSVFDEKKIKGFFKKYGYELRGIKTGIEQSDNKPGNERSKPKKVFEIDVYRPENIIIADGHQREVGEVENVGRDLDEGEKNAALKKFGMKSEGGKYRKRTGDDNRADRAKKYLGLVGDWEGQSNREDAESGKWEKERLQMLKRASDAKKNDPNPEYAFA